MNKHTPGPWHDAGTVVRDDHDHDIAVMSTRWQWGPNCGDVPVQVQCSNARLIAAAPELLEALELLHRITLQTPALSNNSDDRELIDRAWAAIRKARGESTEGKNA